MILSSENCHLLPTNSSSVLSCKYSLMEYFFSHIPIVLSWAHHKVHSKDRMGAAAEDHTIIHYYFF